MVEGYLALLSPLLALLSYGVLLASQSVWMPVLMSLFALGGAARGAKGAGGHRVSSSSSAGTHHQTVNVTVAAQEAPGRVQVTKGGPRDTHTLPCMYAAGLSALLWVASRSAVDDGAVVAVAASAAVVTPFVAKLADRFGSGNPCAVAFTVAAVAGQAYALAAHAGPPLSD